MILLPIFLFAACNKGNQLSFEMKSVQKQAGNCKKKDAPCARVDLKFPIVKKGKQELKKSINDTIIATLIQNFVFEEMQGEPTQERLASVADTFLAEWKKSTEEDAEFATSGWEVSVEGEVGMQTEKMVSVSLSTYSYAGGAHPNSYVTIYNFSLKTGKPLKWKDLVTDMKDLKKLAEKKFKAARELPANADLGEEGFFWDEEFSLPSNFELQKDGIYFWYNSYEAAAFAAGPTEFLVTYEELGKLIRREMIF